MEKLPEYHATYRKILLDTFKYVINFLNNHNLKWFCCYGTLIGAVRHHGLIPWDDDVDICMPKKDFDILISIKDELEIDHYKFLSFSDTGYYCPHSKIINTNTTIWEREMYPFLTGVFVDIFPLYTVNLSGKELKDSLLRYKSLSKSVIRTTKNIPPRLFFRSLLTSHDRMWREFFINKIRFPKYKNGYYLKLLKEYGEQLYKKDGKYAVCLAILDYGEKEIIKESVFSDFVEVPFEDFIVRIPIGYHEYLSQLYGDYMTPPPEEERTPKHDALRYYINLKEGLSLKEVKRRLRRGEKEAY